MRDRVSVTSAEFVRNIGVWQERALTAPVSITYHGRERLVLLAAETYNAVESRNAPTPEPDGPQTADIVLDNVSEGFIALSEDLTVLSINRAAEIYFGRSPQEMAGRNLQALFPTLLGSVFVDQIRRASRTRATMTFDADSFISADHRLAFTIFPLRNGVGVLFVNLSERDALKGVVTRAEAISAALAQLRNVSVAKMDVRGRFVDVDDAFKTWTGFDRSALLKCRLVDLVAPADRRRVADTFDLAVTTREARAVDALLIARDFRERSLSMSFTAIRADDARIEVCAVFASGQDERAIKPIAASWDRR